MEKYKKGIGKKNDEEKKEENEENIEAKAEEKNILKNEEKKGREQGRGRLEERYFRVSSIILDLGERVPLFDLHLLVEVPHELPEDERVDVLAQLVQQEPVTDPGPPGDRFDLWNKEDFLAFHPDRQLQITEPEFLNF